MEYSSAVNKSDIRDMKGSGKHDVEQNKPYTEREASPFLEL